MNLNQLNALIKNNDWQITEMDNELNQLKDKKERLKQQITLISQKIEQSDLRSIVINPEQELTRLSYISHQYQQQENLSLNLKSLEQQMLQIRQKITEIKTKNKMLNRLLERQQQQEKQQQQLAMEKDIEDLILMRDYS